MTSRLVRLAGALLILAMATCAAPVYAKSERVDLRTFVTSWYVHGLPCGQAHAYGPEAVPELVAMLDDPVLEPHWTKVVATLGCIRDASAVEPLMAFLQRQQGEVSADAFRASLGVLLAIGQIAAGGDKTALAIVTDFVHSDGCAEHGVGLAYARYRDDALSEVMGRMAINALGLSGRPQALALLKRMGNDPTLRSDWLDNVEEAITLNERVRSLGPTKAFAEER
jgi:HEAT repeat protein